MEVQRAVAVAGRLQCHSEDAVRPVERHAGHVELAGLQQELQNSSRVTRNVYKFVLVGCAGLADKPFN